MPRNLVNDFGQQEFGQQFWSTRQQLHPCGPFMDDAMLSAKVAAETLLRAHKLCQHRHAMSTHALSDTCIISNLYAAANLPVADAVCRKVPLILVSLPPSPAEHARAGFKEPNEDKSKIEDIV